MKMILGGPGTGKTTRLMSVVQDALEEGIAPNEIAFVSFTNKAALEAKERAIEQFEFDSGDLPYFRTIHSLCYRGIGLSRNNVLGKADYETIGKLLNLRFTGNASATDGPATIDSGDTYLGIISYAEATQTPLREAWYIVGGETNWWRLKQLHDTIRAYKKDTGKKDFADMLNDYAHAGVPVPVRLAIVDEAQDLSPAQWRAVDRAFCEAEQVYVAGDDDQAIYRWSGADVHRFLTMDAEVEVLKKSYRLSQQVHGFSQQLVKRISARRDKTWTPAEHDGSVQFLAEVEEVDFTNGSWMLLARNSFLLRKYTDVLRRRGIAYTTRSGSSIDAEHTRAIIMWERLRRGDSISGDDLANIYVHIKGKNSAAVNPEKFYTMHDLGIDPDIWHDALTGIPSSTREYYLMCMRNGYRLQDPPNVYVGTIHSVKGGEADNVLVCTDMTRKSFVGYEQDADSEHRVFYVAATRARKNLLVLMPQTTRYYRM